MKKNKYQKPNSQEVMLQQPLLGANTEPGPSSSREYDNSSNNNIFSEEP